MKRLCLSGSILILLLCNLFCQAQQTVATNSNATVPPLINFNGTLADANGKPLTGPVALTFSLYSEQTGGAAIWMESQTVQADNNGQYTVMLGATSSQGLPPDLFSSGEARWLGVQLQGAAYEQARVPLVAVPYALKAQDSATVGGLPPSAFVMAHSSGSHSQSGDNKSNPATETQNFIPLFIDSSGDLGNSILFQSGTTAVGINTTAPAATLEVNGTAKFDGLASFASTQTFPNTVESVTAGNSGITIGGTKANPTVSINATFANDNYAQLKAANTFTGNQTVNGSMTATSFSGSGSGLTGVNAAQLGGLASSAFAQLSAANSFTGNQTVSGTVAATSFSGSGTGITGVNATELGGLTSGAFAQLSASNTFTGTQFFNNVTNITGSNSSGVLQVANTGTSGGNPAIFAYTLSTGASAIKGTASATTGITNGLYGIGESDAGYGVQGTSPNVGVYGASDGTSTSGFQAGDSGVWGDTGGPSGDGFVGVLGTADENYAGYFLNNSSSTDTVRMVNNARSSSTAIVFEGVGTEFGGDCFMEVNGAFLCSGTISGAVPVDGGQRKVALYSMQSAESWFEDAGSGQLANGSARIDLDPTFAQTVNTGVEYHVFLTPNGDCRGLYVSQKSATSFEVHELGGGTSSIAFDYRIMAKRAGSENLRLADLTEQFNRQTAQHKRTPHRAQAAATQAAIATPVRLQAVKH